MNAYIPPTTEDIAQLCHDLGIQFEIEEDGPEDDFRDDPDYGDESLHGSFW